MFVKHRLLQIISGFSLIEVMVSAIILSISLLGVASLQSKSIYTVMESSRQEMASQMLGQLTNFALAAEPELVPYIADQQISSANVAACYADEGCEQTDFYKTLVKEWQTVLSTMLPVGQGCTCILSGFTKNQPSAITLRVAINWQTLSGKYATMATDTKIPNALITDSTNVAVCTGDAGDSLNQLLITKEAAKICDSNV